MRFAERKQFLYDPDVFKLNDTGTALMIHAEAVKKFSPNPQPKFMEVDRRTTKYDTLWHVSLDDRTVFSRVLDIPAIVTKERPDWRLTRVGIVPQQKHKFWVANLILQQVDYFPVRGDMVYYDGYRHMIINTVLEPNAFWAQTNVWLGMVCETIIPAEGDARPLINLGEPAPAEIVQSRPLPEA